MIRAKLFFQVGGFDRRFVPNFYKEIDLCFAVRASGHRVVYEPASVVVYHEETSEPENSKEVERVSAASRYNFRRKWAVILRDDHELSDLRNVARAARRRAKPSVLMIDWCVPLYDQDAGSNRIKQLIDGFRRADVHVVFFPNDLKSTNPYTRELQENGVEVVYTVPGITGDWRELFRRTLECVDVVWISRPDLCGKYLPLVRRQSRLPVLYDTIDLHHLRLRRQAEHNGSVDAATWQDVERLEVSCATAADGTIVVSDHEASILRNAGAQEISIIPTIHDMEPQSERCYERTDGILFIGGYAHAPNVDAVQWLIKDIMPIVWGQLPNVVVTLLGSNPPDAVRELAGSLVIVPGYLHDVSGYFKKTRIFVAPLRFGAGVKGKIGQALGHRIPLVTTAIGAEGFDLVDGVHAILAADTSTFASAMVRLYRDSDLWAKLALAADCALEPFSSKRVVGNALAEIHRIIELNRTT